MIAAVVAIALTVACGGDTTRDHQLGDRIGDWEYETEELIDGIEHRYVARTGGFMATDSLTLRCSSTGEANVELYSASLSFSLMFEDAAEFRYKYDDAAIDSVMLPKVDTGFDARGLPLESGREFLFLATDVEGEGYEMKLEVAGLGGVVEVLPCF